MALKRKGEPPNRKRTERMANTKDGSGGKTGEPPNQKRTRNRAAKVAAKKEDMKAPQKEITRLSALLVNSERKEVTARKEIVVDAFREHRCSSGLRWLRKSAGLIARHSNVLSHLANFPSQSEESDYS